MTQKNFGMITSADKLKRLAAKLLTDDRPIGFDIETGYDGEDRDHGSLQPYAGSFIVGFSITNAQNWARYIPLRHDLSGDNLDEDVVWDIMAPVLEAPNSIVAHNCLAGNTEFVTRDGLRTFVETVGEVVEVWTPAGWRKAESRYYGVADLFEVSMRPWRRRSHLRAAPHATANHRWPLRDGRVVTTEELCPGDVVMSQHVEAFPDRGSEAFIHGLIFADGAMTSGHQPQRTSGLYNHQIRLCGSKARFAHLFDGITYPPSYGGDPMCNTYKASRILKDLPPEGVSAEYVADFIEGWQLMDGTSRANGDPNVRIVNTVDESAARWLQAHAALGGWTCTGATKQRVASGYGGSREFSWHVVLSRAPDVAWTVEGVHAAGYEDVYCVEVLDGPDQFTLATGVLTSNSKFEATFLREAGVDLGVRSCTQIEAYVLAEYEYVGLKSLTKEMFGYEQAEIGSLFPESKKPLKVIRFNPLPLEPAVVDYACDDAVWTLALHYEQMPKIEASKALKFVHGLDMQTMAVLMDIERAGVAVDFERLRRWRDEGERFADRFDAETRSEMGTLVGRDLSRLNFRSPKQMREVLYEDLGLPVVEMTKPSKSHPEGLPSTSESALNAAAHRQPEIQRVLDSRQIRNALARFETWAEYEGSNDGLVHASYSQTTVGGGRFAASSPAIQQCPKKWRWELTETDGDGEHVEWSGNFRTAVGVPDGCYYLGFDYSQVELRVMAGLSQEPALMEVFATDDGDVHSTTAAMMLRRPVEEVLADKVEGDGKLRDVGKMMNFALLFGQGVAALAEQLAMTKDRAQELYDAYFSGFTEVEAWMEMVKAQALANGYVTAWTGRKTTLWELFNPQSWIQAKGLRKAVNVPVQGGAADYMRIAMVRCRRALVERGWWGTEVRMIMNQHDALGFAIVNELDPAEVMAVIDPVVTFVVSKPAFPAIRTDWEWGPNWGSAVKCSPDDEFTWTGAEWVRGDAPEPEPEPDEVPTTEASVPVAPLVDESVTVISLAAMPSAKAWKAFRTWFAEQPEGRGARLDTPQGSLSLDGHRVRVKDQPQVSLLLGGASITTEVSGEVDPDVVDELEDVSL